MKTFKFYGVCNTCYKLDDSVWEAIEDPNDGYRSYLSSIEMKDHIDALPLTFAFEAFATVYVQQDKEYDGWQLVDVEDGWVWLRIGTDFSDDYYPSFVFEYSPRPPKPAKPTWLDFIQEE